VTTTAARIAPEHLTEAVAGLLAAVADGRREVLPVLADALEDAGCTDADLLADVRAGRYQATEEGAEVVTVARDGSRCATVGKRSYPIWRTAVYVAARRRDGVLTWRRVMGVGESAAGYSISGAMVTRAMAEAERIGVPYRARVRHGDRCP